MDTANTEAYVSAAAGLWIAEKIGRSIDKKLSNAPKDLDTKVRKLSVEIFKEVGHGILDEVIFCLKNPHSEEEERVLEAKCDYIASLAISIERPKVVAKGVVLKDPVKESPPPPKLCEKPTSLTKEHWIGTIKGAWDHKSGI